MPKIIFSNVAFSSVTGVFSRDEELSLSERFQRKFQKQAIRTSSGVEIKIPTQVYSNADEIEFINNPDGTVLPPDEIGNNGVEWFTYCVLGYSHGILSLVNSKGAPNEGALARVFSCYNNRFSLETEAIPNQNLINELINGHAPEVNRVQIDIAQPDAQILQGLFGFNDREVLQAVGQNTSSIVFEIKPDFRGALSTDVNVISRLIGALQQNRNRYRSVVLSGKTTTGERQRQYDLYEEYFKYPISVSEYRQENGQKIEREKAEILRDYRLNMMNVYNDYKDIILAVSNR